jgi:YbgC/YbaW family acyl-CoA thioester hydrolase
MSEYVHTVQIYYEDTDHSGAEYHPNHPKYFESAREHLLGTDKLVQLLREDGIGFVVYKAALTYRRSVGFGETIEIRSTLKDSSEYRLCFRQNVHRVGDAEVLVEGEVELVCVDRDNELVPLPASVMALR